MIKLLLACILIEREDQSISQTMYKNIFFNITLSAGGIALPLPAHLYSKFPETVIFLDSRRRKGEATSRAA